MTVAITVGMIFSGTVAGTVKREIFIGANFRMIGQNTLRINFRTS